ncbi:hypothetical protein G6F59_018834 [Rhizopus arrhizus]|nr:hypothetical protein G6F59_018834 [Rhizopus arrhizus]
MAACARRSIVLYRNKQSKRFYRNSTGRFLIHENPSEGQPEYAPTVRPHRHGRSACLHLRGIRRACTGRRRQRARHTAIHGCRRDASRRGHGDVFHLPDRRQGRDDV